MDFVTHHHSTPVSGGQTEVADDVHLNLRAALLIAACIGFWVLLAVAAIQMWT